MFFDPGREKEKLMEARKVAAQFAAYVWFENARGAEQSEEEKARFTRKSWKPFMPIAPEGLGRLLLKIAAGRPSEHRKRKQPHQLMAFG
jgi:hypothetical protein